MEKKRFVSVIFGVIACSHTVMHVHQLAQSVSVGHRNSARLLFRANDGGIGKIFFLSKKCGDVNPFQGWFPTPLTFPSEHLILMIHAGLLYSRRFQLSSCACNPSRAGMLASQAQSQFGIWRGLSPLEQEQYCWFWRHLEWMMVAFPDDILIRQITNHFVITFFLFLRKSVWNLQHDGGFRQRLRRVCIQHFNTQLNDQDMAYPSSRSMKLSLIKIRFNYLD